MTFVSPGQIRVLIDLVIEDGGSLFALKIVYRDAKGTRKLRYISPTSWCGDQKAAVWVLCLTTGLVKRLLLNRIESAEPVPAWDMLIPMASNVIETDEPANG